MKSKTIAESIADLRNKLDSIESSTASTILQESTQPLNRLHAHMQTIEQEYLEEGLLGSTIGGIKNYGRGAFFQPARGAAKDWELASDAGKTAANFGKATTIGAGAGGVISADRLYMGKDNPISYLNPFDYGNAHPEWNTSEWKPTDPVSSEKPPVTSEKPPVIPDVPDNSNTHGGDAKPHAGLQYDPKVEKLQQFLNGQGASLAVDGKFGQHTQAAWEDYQQHKLSSHSSTPNVPDVPNVPDASAPPVATPNANADADFNAQMKAIQDQFNQLAQRAQGLSKDPNVSQEITDIVKNAGL